MIDFSGTQLERYSRHIIMENIGVEGQSRICSGRVLVVGAGGLGSPAAYYLAAAGVGTVGIVDSDVVDISNLQRQIIHSTDDLNRPKVESASEKMRALNPDMQVNVYHELLRADNARQIIRDYDFVVDGTDNFAAKFLINDACIMEKKPFSHGGVLRFNGQTMTVLPRETACVRCVFEKPPPAGTMPTCAEAGILGSVAGMLGTVQATEALKHIASAGEPLADAMLFVDAATMNFTRQTLRRNRNCAICGEHPTILELYDEEPQECDVL